MTLNIKRTVSSIKSKGIIKVIVVASVVVIVTVVGVYFMSDITVLKDIVTFMVDSNVIEGAKFNLLDIPKEVIVEGVKYI